MNDRAILWLALAAMTFGLAGCGATRCVWTYDHGDPPQELTTRQSYAIESFLVTPHVGDRGDAVSAPAAENGFISRYVVSKEWLDCLYETYPNVFSRTGTPVRITAVCGKPSDGDEQLKRSKFRYVLGKIGVITILPIFPIETVAVYDWKIELAQKDVSIGSCAVRETQESLVSCSPLGLLCSYGTTTSGDFQFVGGMYENGKVQSLHQQIRALGAGVIVQLARLEQKSQTEDSRVSERKKNLDSLLKSGVITEEEYRKELGKGAK